MPNYGRNGYPVGTIIEVLHLDEEYKQHIGKRFTITHPLHYSSKYGCWMYGISLPLGGVSTSLLQPRFMKLIKLPLSWENWARNKVLLCCGYKQDLFDHLVYEKIQGNSSDYGGKDCTYEIKRKDK